MIYENEKDIAKACDCYFIAAEITKRDTNMWSQVLEMSEKLNLRKRQLYCLSRLIHLLPEDTSFLEKRYQLWIEDNQPMKAVNDLLSICKISNDVTKFIPVLYEYSIIVHREEDVLTYLESQYAMMIARLSMFLPYNALFHSLSLPYHD